VKETSNIQSLFPPKYDTRNFLFGEKQKRMFDNSRNGTI